MEENKETTTEKLSYEELEQIAIQMQNRAMQAEARLASFNLAAMRLEYLFKVLDKAPLFPQSFVDDCVTEVVNRLEVKKGEPLGTPE